jgi:hypothetical protein
MMCAMILRLDHRRPIVWRTPTSLQIGVDPVLAVLADVSDAEVRLIDALSTGVTRSGLDMLADRAGIPLKRVDALVVAVKAALVSGAPAQTADSAAAKKSTVSAGLVVRGSGVGATRIAAVLIEAGHSVALSGADAAGHAAVARTRRPRPEVAVLVSAHVVDPHEHLRWLRRDVAHLPVVFGEAAVTIGPLVMPGVTACVSCVEQQRTGDDAARPALVSQLWGTPAAAEDLGFATEAAIEALRMLRARAVLSCHEHVSATATAAAGAAAAAAAAAATLSAEVPPPSVALSVRLDAETGERTIREWWPMPACGCRGFSGLSGLEPRQENGWATARHAPMSPAEPMTALTPLVRV